MPRALACLTRTTAVALAALALGCASTSGSEAERDLDLASAVEEHNAQAEEKDRVVCTKERPTGSHIPRRVCRTVADIERERERVERMGRTAGGGAPESGPR